MYEPRGVPSTLGLRPSTLDATTGHEAVDILGEWETPVGGADNNTLYGAFRTCPARRTCR
ncbi:hypothetical protein OG413_34480 [Streptomyces sp. NBC_01433]|uniref:hypothetical protein n=1 Tax=Streptomyces sp. NBC_01433 TaxID=2903864 RepID=UPI00225794AF|nr:hypothetical protein [Streptomyces sp. NBC_01433]MCX4680325.1 hypothetical protein [Streptomyces sp. NBC_01433]